MQIGGRIKRLRRQKNMGQAELAQVLGISPSYLNLIEHNRRRVTVSVLMKAASHFGVEAGELADNEEPRLTGDLMEIFGDNLFADSDVTNQDIRDFAGSNPAVARAVLRLFDSWRALKAQTADAAARGLEPGVLVATDAVSDFLQENSNYFGPLEDEAERMRHDIDFAADSFEYGLKTYLFNVFGLQWKVTPLPGGTARRLDATRGEILTSDVLPGETSVFVAAQQLALMASGHTIDRLIAESTLPAEAAPLARNALAAYVAGALMMPYAPFLAACRETRYDIERVGRRFRASFEQVCHRMTSLQRPGQSGVPLHLVRTDIAGNISKRFSLSGIHIPRHSGACPRWNVYAAFLHPQEINVQVSQMPEGQRYFCIAKSIAKGGHRHGAPRRHLSIGLGCHVALAGQLIYSDGLDLDDPRLAVPIGVGCRSCPRLDCEQRAQPLANHRFELDETRRAANIFAQP
jgi:predicted transcriptional regulator/transcriptional regulator with XRE-family HTH domain